MGRFASSLIRSRILSVSLRRWGCISAIIAVWQRFTRECSKLSRSPAKPVFFEGIFYYPTFTFRSRRSRYQSFFV